MYFVPDGTKVCGLYECSECYMRFLSLETEPMIYCPYCERDFDMEFGPDEMMPEETDTARLIKIVRDEEVELMDGLLSLALTGGDYEWL